MRAITLTCEHLSMTLAPSAGGMIVPSLRIEHDPDGWIELARELSIRVGHDQPEWSIADRSPASARLVRNGAPIGVVARCEVTPGRIELGVEYVNSTSEQVTLDACVSCRVARSLTKHAEDPEIEISGPVATFHWAPSDVRLTASSAGALHRVSCDHGSTDAPWLTLSASADTRSLEPHEVVSGALTLAFARGG